LAAALGAVFLATVVFFDLGVAVFFLTAGDCFFSSAIWQLICISDNDLSREWLVYWGIKLMDDKINVFNVLS